MAFDVRADKVVMKASSLMGPRSGPPSSVECDKDGKITRIRPFYYDEVVDWESKNPWSMEAHGSTFNPPARSLPGVYYMAYKTRVYSHNRVRYPLKRVDWDPKGDRNTQNRGKSKYVRISWDEAAQLIADELIRVKETYGAEAILSEADMHGEGKKVAPSHGCANKLLSLLGAYTIQMRNEDSWEGWYWGSKHVWGTETVGEMQPSGNLIPDIAQYSQQLLFWAADPETTAVGFDGYMSSRISQWVHKLGVRYVYVDPALNFSACYLADKWIPLKPNTDAALYLGIIYTWLKEDLYDKEYVKTHVVGEQPFFDYVLGKEDGIPKTPKWASEKCGVPSWTVKALAREWYHKVTSIMIGNGGAGIRGPFATEPCRLQSICLGMQGLGKHGRHQSKVLEWNLHTDVYPVPYQGEKIINVPMRAEQVRPPMNDEVFSEFKRLGIYEQQMQVSMGRFPKQELRDKLPDLDAIAKPYGDWPKQSIPKCLVHDAILNGEVDWWGLWSFCGPKEEQFAHFHYPQPGASGIHMIWTDSPCMVTCWNDGFRFVKAVRDPSIECIVAQHPWLENDCYMADIILPVATKFEMEDVCDDSGSGVITSVYRERIACPPVGESMNDWECVREVARKLGPEIYNAYTSNDLPLENALEALWQASGVAELDVDDEFHKKDIFVCPVDPTNKDKPLGLNGFAEDPENHPLNTPTGKLEFTSTNLLKYFPDDPERPPYPKWIEYSALHDERLDGERAKKYPVLCMSNHGRYRFHANCDDIIWNREIDKMKIRAKDGYQYESAWINPVTAKQYGIEHGDIIKVYNERGTVLCGAYVTPRVIEGTVYVDHGSRFDPIEAETLDRGGAINLITPTAVTSEKCCGMVVSGFLVGIAKVSDEEMEGWKKQYPESFARKLDEACGQCLDGWLIEE
jgi:trimethylamine-N-oxide reductase (cytochrome c)